MTVDNIYHLIRLIKTKREAAYKALLNDMRRIMLEIKSAIQGKMKWKRIF